jgi:hypothetical protein
MPILRVSGIKIGRNERVQVSDLADSGVSPLPFSSVRDCTLSSISGTLPFTGASFVTA